MAAHNKLIGRTNDFYQIWDVAAYNNVGSDLAVGAVVLLDWTSVGDDNSLICAFTAALVTTHIKGVVKKQANSSGILASTWGEVRIQGPVDVAVSTGNAFTKGDPIYVDVASSATGSASVRIATVIAPGTNSTYISQSVGASLATTASLGTAQTMTCFFDGTNLNAIYMKD